MAVMDFERLLQDHLELIDRIIAPLGRRHRLTREECQDFRSVVMIKLIDNDYQVLRTWCGKSSLGGYLKVVIHHEYSDYRNHELGKWRAPADVRRRGPLAQKLYKMLDRDGMTVDAACTMFPPEDHEEVRRLADQLQSRAKRTFVGDEQLDQLQDSDLSPEELVIARERAIAFEKLTRSLSQAVAALPKEDRVLVQLRMEEGVKLANLARLEGLDARQFYARWNSIVVHLGKVLAADGYDKEHVKSLLQTRLLVEVDEEEP